MQRPDFIAIAPLLILSAFAVIVMVAIALKRDHKTTMFLSFAGLGAALASLAWAAGVSPRPVTPILVIDGYALFYMALILVSALATLTLSYDYLNLHDDYPEEFYLLVLLATLGSMVLVASRHMASFFLGLEILSVSLYALVSYIRSRNVCIEAGLKYLVLAAVSAGFLLFGAALIYADTGRMDFSLMADLFRTGPSHSLVFIAGTGLIIVAIGFKLAVAPFHMWTPDIYQGAPAPVTAFVATASKGAMAALLVRLFAPGNITDSHILYMIFALMAAASMIIGNVLSLMQSNIKRLLAYSSIAHMGYLLTAFVAGGQQGATVVTFYLAAYAVSIMGCFGIVAILSSKTRDAESFDDIRGLFHVRPWTSAVFTAMLLSLAGIPLTAGFIGKFFIVAHGTGTAHLFLVFILVLTSGAGLFYYLRIIVAMFSLRDESRITPEGPMPPMGVMTLALLTGLLVWLGVTPSWFLQIIEKMTH